MEIYMMHGLLLNIFKSSAVIQFSSIEGYLLAAGNFALTIGLCAVVIRLLNQYSINGQRRNDMLPRALIV